MARDPLTMTGSICLKSPDRTTTLPPKGVSGVDMMSLNVVSKSCRRCLCAIGASSHMMSLECLINLARISCTEMVDVLECGSMCSGNLNVECAVVPPVRSWAAMPEVATGRTTFPCPCTASIKAFKVNVLPQPPGASRKNRCDAELVCCVAVRTASKKDFCSSVMFALASWAEAADFSGFGERCSSSADCKRSSQVMLGVSIPNSARVRL